MTDEEMRKTMQFILEQQAQSAAKIDALADAQRSAEERWTHTEESIRSLLSIAEIHEREINGLGDKQAWFGETQSWLGEMQARLAETQARLGETQTRLGETQSQLAEAQARTDKQMAETDKRMAETDERLNALINTVERFISKGQNGRNGE
jgi:hypothetical protein